MRSPPAAAALSASAPAASSPRSGRREGFPVMTFNVPHAEAVAAAGASKRERPSRVPLVLRLAARELRGGIRGFAVFLLCLALGVAAMAGVGSLARGLTEGLAREGRTILGGDASF